MQRKDTIMSWMQAHEDEMIEDLKTLCRIRSVRGEAAENAPYGEGPAKALAAAMEMCSGYGLDVKNHGWRVMTADFGGREDRALDILAHLDVVNEGDGWDTDPYEPVIKEDGCIYGRGTADDKDGVIASLYAARCVKELGLPLKKGCRLIFGTDEECGSSDVAYYYEREKPAPNTFSPDADYPVCNAEKGFFRLRFRKSWDAETALPRVIRLDGGLQINAIPTEASAVIAGMKPDELLAGATPLCAELGAVCRAEEAEEGARLVVIGRGGHAAMPSASLNANTVLIRVLTELPLAECASTLALHQISRLLPHGDWLGKNLGIAQSDAQTGELTCSFTMIRFTDTGLEGLCDCRVPICANEQNCRDTAFAAMTACGMEPSGEMVAPHYTDPDSDFIRTLLSCYELYTGQKGECFSMGGGTYVHDVPGGVAFGMTMPGTEVRMHGANERYPVRDLVMSAAMFAEVIAEICG